MMSWTSPEMSISPRSMIPTLLQKSASSGRMCEEMMMVLPIAFSSLNSSLISIRARGSRPDAGSSRSSTLGSWISVLARHSRCFMPVDNSST